MSRWHPDRYDVMYLTALGALLLVCGYIGGTERVLHAGAGMFVGVLIGAVHVWWRRRHRA